MNADDQQLIAECLNGRSAAFGELVRRHQDRLYNTVYRLLDNAEDAEDVVQEAFVHAYQSLRSFKGDSLFFTWLYRIAMNTAVSWKRKQQALSRRQAGSEQEARIAAASAEGRGVQPEQALQVAEERQRVRTALNRVSPEHRAVLILKDMDCQSYEAMATILEVPIGTIRSRLHRARLELRGVLENMDLVEAP